MKMYNKCFSSQLPQRDNALEKKNGGFFISASGKKSLKLYHLSPGKVLYVFQVMVKIPCFVQ